MKKKQPRIGFQIWELSHVLAGQLNRRLEAIGITVAQMGALIRLHETPAISTADLARSMFMTPQNLSLIVGKMEAQGYLRRVPHETHGRVRRLLLTRTGSLAVKAAIKCANGLDRELLGALSPEERLILPALLQRCLHLFKQSNGAPYDS